MPLADHDLIKKRKQELKHVQDIKEHYEKKLGKVQDLYVELETWRLQLEEKQRNLERKEKQLNIHSSKVYYKKKPKPLVISKAQERLQKRTAALKSPNSTTPDGGRSTSPESPFKLPPVLQQPSPSRIGAAAVVAAKGASVVDSSSQYANRPQVRVNPLYFRTNPSTDNEDVFVPSAAGAGSEQKCAPFPCTTTTPTTCSTTLLTSKARMRVRLHIAPHLHVSRKNICI